MLDFLIKKLFSNKAYSIVEVAVSLVIIGVFLTSTLALFNASLNLSQKIEQQNLAIQALQSSVAQIQNSLNIKINAKNLSELMQNGAYFYPLANNNSSTGYNFSSNLIKFDKENQTCLEDPNAQVNFDNLAEAQKPQYPVCIQILFKQVDNSKNVYCYAVRVTTKLSEEDFYSQTANGITSAQFLAVPDSQIINTPGVRDYFGCGPQL